MAEPDTIQSIHFDGVTVEAAGVDFIINTTDGNKHRQTWEDYGDGVVDFMQYTGLKDKNGKEIYEGDITKEHGLVEHFMGLYRVNKDGDIRILSVDISSTSIEIVGNIYENHE